MKKIWIIAGIIALIILSAMAFAEEEIVSVSGDTVRAGEELKFRIDLEKIDPNEYGPYELAFAISSEETRECFDFKENVDVRFNVVNGIWSVSSEELRDLKALNGSVSPHAAIEEETEYTVTVTIAGRDKVTEEEFTFTALPEEDPGEDPGDDPDEEPGEEPEDDGDEPEDATDAADAEEETAAAKDVDGGSSDSGFSDDGGEEPDPKYVYQGSANNYLESLEISGHELNETFHKVRTIYFVDTGADTSSLDVKAVPSDRGARVDIAGNGDVSEEMSKIVIKVTAPSGDERTYRVYVRHNEE